MKTLAPGLLASSLILSACGDSDPSKSNPPTPDEGLVVYRLTSANVNIGDQYGGSSPSVYEFHYDATVEFRFQYVASGEIQQVEIFSGDQLLSRNLYTNNSAANWHIDNQLYTQGLPQSQSESALWVNEDWVDFDSRYMWGRISEAWGDSATNTKTGGFEPLAKESAVTDSHTTPVAQTLFKRQFTENHQLEYWESSLNSKIINKAQLTYYGNGLIRTLERESLATIFSSTASDGFTEQLEPVISQFYSYPLITANTLQMRIESTDLTTQIQRVFVANYERGVCGPMLSERSKNMLPLPMPFCIVYKK